MYSRFWSACAEDAALELHAVVRGGALVHAAHHVFEARVERQLHQAHRIGIA